VVDVESEPDSDPAMSRVRERAGHEARGRLREIEVVEGEVERLLSA
jgi:hypothetical protein